MTSLENWVLLQPGVPVSLHFKAHKIVERIITDATFGVSRTVRTLMLLVDEQDGNPVDKTYSIISTKLMGEISGYLEGNKYLNYVFTIIKDAPGTVPPRISEVKPR